MNGSSTQANKVSFSALILPCTKKNYPFFFLETSPFQVHVDKLNDEKK